MAAQDKGVRIGEVLRQRRLHVLRIGLREAARRLDIAAAYLTDIEKGRRSPSEALLKRIARVYEVPEGELRAGWQRAEPIVGEVATQNPTTAVSVPEFLRTARNLTPEQWEELIDRARQMRQQGGGDPRQSE